MKARYKFLIVVIAIIVSAFLYETYNYFKYRGIEVTNYNTLMLKAEYGNVTKKEIRIGAEDLVENYFCKRANSEIVNEECIGNLKTYGNACAKKHIEGIELKEMNEHKVYEIIRIYKVCLENKNMF
jgi:hypothetical protein